MALRWRPIQSKDVLECAEIIRAHPVIGPRYRSLIKDLGAAWLRLLGCQAMTTAVFERVEERGSAILAVGVGVFVHDDFIRELKKPPLFWVGPEVVKRVMRGDSPVLSDREVRAANSGEGLNELVWEALSWAKFANLTELYHLMGRAYIELLRGFRLKEMITSQAESVERLQWAVDAGGLYWDPTHKRYTRSLLRTRHEFVKRPHVVGITREMEFARPGSWIGSLFDYHPPCLSLSPGEQRLLLSALPGDRTDLELAQVLRVSLATVKKTWLSIYRRVADRKPEIVSVRAHLDAAGSERGKEKRRSLIAYLREHPEELRPVSQRILAQATAGKAHFSRAT